MTFIWITWSHRPAYQPSLGKGIRPIVVFDEKKLIGQIQFRSKVNDCNLKHKSVGWYSVSNLIPGCCIKHETCFGIKAKLVTKDIYITESEHIFFNSWSK